jgi:hypothetical protein
LFETIGAGAGTVRNIMPTLASGTNQIAQATKTGLMDVFKTLRSNEMRQNFRSMFQIFEKSIGPGLRGFANVLMVIGRIIRAVAPFVERWAKSWEDTTKSWRRGTRDSTRLSRFFDKAVDNFKAWWNLAKALGGTLKLIFQNSHTEGLKVVTVLTNLVLKFNEWLYWAGQDGKITTFWEKYNQSVTDATWALQHPIQAIKKWLPVIMDTIATTIATHGPTAALLFVNAFMNAGSWAQLLTVAWALKKFGFFSMVGNAIAGVFLKPFLKQFAIGFAGAIGGEALAGSLGTKIAGTMTVAGKSAGGIFGKMFMLGVIAAMVVFGPDLRKKASDLVPKWLKPLFAGPEDIVNQIIHPGRKKSKEREQDFEDVINSLIPDVKLPTRPGGAFGGVIPPGGSSIIGETGPEVAFAGARGTKITPLARNSRNTFTQPDIPNLAGAFHITVISHLNVDKREIARAVNDDAAYNAARRGGQPLRPLRDPNA